jgi:hypothetical protein
MMFVNEGIIDITAVISDLIGLYDLGRRGSMG